MKHYFTISNSLVRQAVRRGGGAGLLLMLSFGFGSSAVASTVYEDGSAGADARWSIVDRKSRTAGARNVVDKQRGSVVDFGAGSGDIGDAYLIGGKLGSWGNFTDGYFAVRLRTTSDFALYVIAQTNKGRRMLRYRNRDKSMLGYKAGYIDHALGSKASDGAWQRHVRDLEADLRAGDSKLRLTSVIGVIFRGTGRLDELALYSSGSAAGSSSASVPAPAPPSSSVPAAPGGSGAPSVSGSSGGTVPASDSTPDSTPDTTSDPSSSPSPTVRQNENGKLLAFPGAEGHGRFSRGGRGGRTVIVDTLEDRVADDGRTSLREALETMSGARTIVFQVGGTFNTGSNDILMNGADDSNVTLACQTAPSPGVLIKGSGIRMRNGAHDIIMRHCSIRNTDPGRGLADSNRALAVIGTQGDTRDLIFDHMSLGWATDENFTAFVGPTAKGNVKNITLSRSIIAEGDGDSNHSKSGRLPQRYLHSMGPSCGSSSANFRVLGCSIVGNLIAHNGRRNPLIWGSSGEVVNNVIYNWQETALDARPHKPGRVDLHVTGNLFKSGPNSKPKNSPMIIIDGGSAQTGVKASNNRFEQNGTTRVFANVNYGSPRIGANRISPFRLECIGASRPARSAFDSRVISEYRSGSGQVGIRSTHDRVFSGFNASRHSSTHDKDRDGMADSWERRVGLNPADASDGRRDADKDGYTNIEEYINSIAQC